MKPNDFSLVIQQIIAPSHNRRPCFFTGYRRENSNRGFVVLWEMTLQSSSSTRGMRGRSRICIVPVAGGRRSTIRKSYPVLIRGSFLFAVAVDRKTGHAVGMGRVISDGISDGYIQDLVVLPEYRKTGIGTQIVSLLVKKCVEQGISWIGLIAEPDTEKFYLPFGFHPMEGYVPLIFRSKP